MCYWLRLLCIIAALVAGDLEWTQYSDRADLPMSKRARDNIREKLKAVDPNDLSPHERETYERLSAILNEEVVQEDGVGMELLLVPLLFAIVGVALYVSANRSQPAGSVVNMNEAREARLKKFT